MFRCESGDLELSIDIKTGTLLAEAESSIGQTDPFIRSAMAPSHQQSRDSRAHTKRNDPGTSQRNKTVGSRTPTGPRQSGIDIYPSSK
jgi:hypothetical protein